MIVDCVSNMKKITSNFKWHFLRDWVIALYHFKPSKTIECLKEIYVSFVTLTETGRKMSGTVC